VEFWWWLLEVYVWYFAGVIALGLVLAPILWLAERLAYWRQWRSQPQEDPGLRP
jgi:hypothetical protein